MDDVEYILRLVLKARDEMAAVLAKARTQLRGFATDSDKLNTSLDALNKNMDKFNKNMDGVTEKLQAWRAVLKDAGAENDKVVKGLDKYSKAAGEAVKGNQQLQRTQEQLQQRARNLRKEVNDLTKARQNETVSAKFAATEYDRLAKELEKVSLKMSQAARTKTPAQNWAIQAKEAADTFRDIDKQITEDAKAESAKRLADEKQTLSDIQSAIDNHVKFRKASEAEITKSVSTEIKERARLAAREQVQALEAQKAADRKLVEEGKLTQQQLAQNVKDYNDRVDSLQKEWGAEWNRVYRETEQANTEIVRAEAAERERISKVRADAEANRLSKQLEDQKKVAVEAERVASRAAEAARLQERAREVGGRVRAGGRDAGDIAELRQLQQGFTRLASSAGDNTDELRRFGAEAEHLRGVLRSTTSDTDKTTSAFARFKNGLRSSSQGVAGFDNQVRGMGLLLAVASIQQLTSAAIALGGELVSLAGSAIMAGGALGGILAAGAAQALPVLGLLAGAFQRVKSVFDAFQQGQKLQQATATDAEKKGQKQIDYTNRLANAQDAQAAAQDNLAESRKALTQANADAARQLEDLIFQEKAAALAAKGASLNVKEAQKALRDAVAGGASALEIQQRQQSLDEARQGAGRARVTARRATQDRQAVGGQAGNLPGVQSATKGVQDAERALSRANRSLDQAADKTDRAGSSTMTAAANLNFLLSQLSPAERKLYEALNRVYDTYRKVFQGTGTKGSGIYGVIIGSFTNAVDAVNKIMQDPEVIKTIQGLADEIGKQFNNITKSFTDTKTLDQLQGIIHDASENLGPLVDMALDLAHAFLNIAEAANPAFQKLLEYLGPIVDKFLAMTEDKDKMEDFFLTGEEHLESWLDLIGAIIGLFAVLTGASAEEGKTSIDDLTKKIKGWTDWLKDHRKEVVGFFEDARQAAYDIGGVVENLAGVLFRTFDADRVSNFADILNKAILPALETAVTGFGKVTDFVGKIVDTPVGAQIAKWLIVIALFAKVGSGVVGIFAKLATTLEKAGKFIAFLARPITWLLRITGLTRHLITLFEVLQGVARTAFLAALGPVGLIVLAIAAVIAGVVLLLHHFGKLDDIWRAIKGAFAGFLEDIQPAIDTLVGAFEDLGIHLGSIQDIIKVLGGVLEQFGKYLADWLTTYIIGFVQGIFKILAGVAIFLIDTIAAVVKVLHGLADIIVGVFTLDWDQIKKGFLEISDGLYDFVDGLLKGLEKALEGLLDIFLAPFKASWEAVKGFFGIHSPSTLAAELGHDIIQGLVNGARAAVKAVGRVAGWIWDRIRDSFRNLGAAERRLFSWLVDKWLDLLRAEIRGFKRIGEWVWDAIKSAVRGAAHLASGIVSWLWNKFTGLLKLEIQGFKNIGTWIWHAFEDAVKDIGGKLVDIGKSIGGKIISGIKSVAGSIKNLFGGDDDDKEKAAPAKPRASAADINQAMGVVPFGAKDLKDAQNIYGEFWKELRRTARTSTDFIQRQFRDMRISTSESSDKMYRDIRGSIADIQNSFNVRGKTIVETWSDNWFSLMVATNDGLNYIGHQTNLALKALGEKHINFGLTEPKKTDKKQRGGMIPGSGDGDKVHVLAEPGEGFINKRAVRALGGPAAIAAINSMIPRFQTGGTVPQFAPIPGMPNEEANTRVIPLIVKLIAKYHAFVTDAYDRDHSAGHKSPGHNVTGTAVDMTPQNPTDAGWNMIEAMGKWAVSKGMIVGYGAGVPGSQAWPGHGRGNHIHIELGANPGAAAAVLVETMAKIGRPIVTGAKVMASISQAAIDKMLKAANAKLAETFSATQGGATDFKVGKVGAGAGNIFKFFRQHGFTDEQAAAWVGNFQQESGLDPTIIQPGGEGHGLAQWGGGRFAALQSFAASHKKPWTDMGTQLAFVMYELSGPEASAMRQIKAAKTVEQATNAVGGAYERFGIQGDRSGPARDAFAKFAGKYAEGGIIPGGDGLPVNILAHAGEWVLNKGQQLRAAMLSGLSVPGLRSLLGFHGGPGGFQGGGEIGTRLGRVTRVRPVPAADRSLARGIDTYEELMHNLSQMWGKIGQQSAIALAKTKKRAGNYQAIANTIDRLTEDKGILETLATAISDQLSKAEVKLKAATFRIRGGVVVRALGDVTVAQRELKNIVDNYKDLVGERSVISEGLKNVNKELAKVAKDPSLTDKQRTKLTNQLTGQRIDLVKNLDRVDSEIADATEARWNAQVAAQQAVVDRINRRHEQVGKGLDLAKRMAAAVGNTDVMTAINQQISNNMAGQITDLQARIAAAKKIGNKDLVTTLTDQINDLRVSIFEAAQQAIQDSVDAVNQAASRRLTRLDLFGRMADAMGVVSSAVGVNVGGETMSRAGVFAARGAALGQQQTGLQGALGQAAAAGNMKLVQDLTDQLAELSVTIQENSRATFQAKIDEATGRSDFDLSINDLNKQLQDSKDALTGVVDSTEALRLANERATLLQQRQTDLQALMQEAIARGDTKAQQDLQKALLENQIAINGNTKAIQDATGAGSAPASYTSTAWQWFRSAFLTGTGGVIPQYTPPVMGDVNSIGPGGGTSSTSTTNNGATIVNNFEINEAGGPIDITKVASTVVFAQSTAQ